MSLAPPPLSAWRDMPAVWRRWFQELFTRVGGSSLNGAVDQVDLTLALAPIASPAFTGTPTAPTASAGTSSTQIATTAFAAGLSPWVIVRAVGDGVTDDTAAFVAALASAVAGQTVLVPPGRYRITSSLTLKSGVTIQGLTRVNDTYGIPSGDEAPVYIYLDNLTSGMALFSSVGTQLHQVTIRDVHLGAFATPQTTPDSANRRAIDIEGRTSTGDSLQFAIERVQFDNWAIAVVVADTSAGTASDWNVAAATVRQSTFTYNSVGVYFNTVNADAWLFDTCNFYQAAADSIGVQVERGGFMTFQNSFFNGVDLGGGLAANMAGVRFTGTGRDSTLFLNCQSESLTNFIVVDAAATTGVDTLWPLTLMNCPVESDITLAADAHFISIANRYGGSTGGGVVYATTSGTVIDSYSDTFQTASKGFNVSGGAMVWNAVPAGGSYGVGLGIPGTIVNGEILTASADRGDTSQTITVGVDAQTQRWATALTANRTVTLSVTNARNGHRFRIVRTGLGAFTLDVGGLKTIPAGTAAFVDVAYDGSAWSLTGYGTL